MPSPVAPSDFCDVIPSPSTGACAAVKKLFFTFPKLLCDLLTYMFGENGLPTTQFKNDMQLVPTGAIIGFGAPSAPDGWLICDGRAVSRTTYSALFAVIGTRYGAGDLATTFNLPDSRERVEVGWNPSNATYDVGNTGGSAATSSVPEHEHTMTFPQAEGTEADPASQRFLYTPKEVEAGAGGVGGGGTDVDSFPQVVIATDADSNKPTEISLMQPYYVATKIIKT